MRPLLLLLGALSLSRTAHAEPRQVHVPDELAPLRARLEKKRPRLVVDCWIAPIPELRHENPCFLAADLDGDGRRDLALMVREKGGKQRRGVAVITAGKVVAVAGAGTRAGAGGDDFSWMDAWQLEPGGIVVAKTESASGLLSWKAGRLVWRQLGD